MFSSQKQDISGQEIRGNEIHFNKNDTQKSEQDRVESWVLSEEEEPPLNEVKRAFLSFDEAGLGQTAVEEHSDIELVKNA